MQVMILPIFGSKNAKHKFCVVVVGVEALFRCRDTLFVRACLVSLTAALHFCCRNAPRIPSFIFMLKA